MRRILLATMLAAASTAQAAVIDFEEFYDGVQTQELQTKGFTILGYTENDNDNLLATSPDTYNLASLPATIDDAGLYVFAEAGSGSSIYLVNTNNINGGTSTRFTFDSFVTSQSESLEIRASYIELGNECYYDNIGNECTYSALTSSLISEDLGDGLVKYILPESWVGVDSVQISTTGTTVFDGFFIDNIEVNASVVPVPPAVWLFGSSLAVLGWLRRKRTV